MSKALFPGSFDPFTIGHDDIVQRGLQLFDEIIIGIGRNSVKNETFPIREREAAIKKIYADNPKVKVLIYDGLTIDFAKAQNAHFILRGIRGMSDFEYERNLAEANLHLGGIETILLYTRPQFAYISSTLVRDLCRYNQDVSSFVPNNKKL